jgi:hypothetical protein
MIFFNNLIILFSFMISKIMEYFIKKNITNKNAIEFINVSNDEDEDVCNCNLCYVCENSILFFTHRLKYNYR